ncbi:MAG: DUF4286 family protein [Chitinophagales bacterium]
MPLTEQPNMILYNITIKADLDIAQELKFWIKEDYLPEINSSEKVIKAHLLKLLGVDVSDGITFCVQYHFDSMSEYNSFKMVEDAEFMSEIMSKFSDKLVLFASILSEE